jgi:hypothetical protein
VGAPVFYLISPPGISEWTFDLESLTEDLQHEWPQANVVVPEDGPLRGIMVATIPTPEGSIEVSQNSAAPLQALHLDGPLRGLARYTAWWRAWVPAEQPQIFYDEAFSTVIDLRPGIRSEDILAQFS